MVKVIILNSARFQEVCFNVRLIQRTILLKLVVWKGVPKIKNWSAAMEDMTWGLKGLREKELEWNQSPQRVIYLNVKPFVLRWKTLFTLFCLFPWDNGLCGD